jgi:hypothetical protein
LSRRVEPVETLPKPKREYHEWTNGANFSKTIGKIRVIRVKKRLPKKRL